MRIFLAICALCILATGSVTLAEHPHVEAAEVAIFLEACEAIGADCSAIPAPVVVRSRVVDYLLYPARGYGLTMSGEPLILINTDLSIYGDMRDPTYEDVVFHESIHYIHDRLGYQTTGRDACWSEREARVHTAIRMGVEYDDSWEVNYGCAE